MNPITAWKLFRKGKAVAEQIEAANASKSLWRSKTFWFNLLTAVGELVQVLSGTTLVPPGTLAIVAAVINIGLRTITNEPVHVAAPTLKPKE